MKKNGFKTIAIILLFGAFVLFLVPVRSANIAHVLLLPVEKKIQKTIEFGTSRIWLPGNLYFENISILDKKNRLYRAKTAEVRYNLVDLLVGKREVSFDIRGVKVYTEIGLLDSIAAILSISKIPDFTVDQLTGALQLRKDAIYLKDIYAASDKIRIRGEGWLNNNGLLNCDINFSFSRDITDMIPEIVREILLRDEGNGWKGIAFKVTGNYKKPSLHLTGETLKINIMDAIFKDD